MNIAIDARWIFPEITGIGAYTRELLRHLAAQDGDNRYLLLFGDAGLRDRTFREAALTGRPNVAAAVLPYGLFSIRNQLQLPGFLRRQGVDVFHSTNYMIPLAAFPRRKPGRIGCVVTVHDVIPLLFPEAAPRSRKSRVFALYRRLMIEIGRRADRIVTVSETSRGDVIRQLRIPADRAAAVQAIHSGIGDMFRPAPPTSPGPGRTILYVGRSDPYKNLFGLVEAFAAARARCREPLRLVIVGPRDPRYPEPAQRALTLGVGAAVTWAGYLHDDALVAAYQQADVLAMPSRYEGFGFPVLEAMACGTPVVCSDIPTHREIAGDAAMFANPESTPELADALVRVLTDAALRRALAAQGLARAARFTWAATAARTLAVYRELAPVVPLPSARDLC
jgi:glycosyltransferase involved in cell wall biosynthesis